MTNETTKAPRFRWQDLGNIPQGRPNLGGSTEVVVYRLMQYTLRDTLINRYGAETAREILVEAGRLAGSEFCTNLVDTKLDFNGFIADLQEKLRAMNMAVLRIETADLGPMELTLTLSEDLDCSGLPLNDETVCDYDEGFLAGIMEAYCGRAFIVRETDCWSTGKRTCRFSARPADEVT